MTLINHSSSPCIRESRLFISIALILTALLASPAFARELVVGFLSQADDPRYTQQQLEKAYPSAPAGRSQAALALALDDAAFTTQAAGITKTRIVAKEAADESQLSTALQALLQAGVRHIVLELPASGVLAVSSALKALPTAKQQGVLLFNTAAPEDVLRGAQCSAALLHTLPSHAMQMDALAQLLAARKWTKPLLLHAALDSARGASPDAGSPDALLLVAFNRSAKRFGIKPVATRSFKLSNDPRERDLGNVRLLTANADYDVIVALDASGEFARDLPYRSVLARPVVGSSGLTAQAWSAFYERNGAPQLNRRFAKRTGRAMGSYDWATWSAGRALVEIEIKSSDSVKTPSAKMSSQAAPALTPRWADIAIDGYKGQPLSLRAWDGQLRQPMLLAHGNGLADIAPLEGFLHPKSTLDTLGFDVQETGCHAMKDQK
jgi:ABC transporter substrate binding protein (PQQ-dependent alcohol dehydrogenase system)